MCCHIMIILAVLNWFKHPQVVEQFFFVDFDDIGKLCVVVKLRRYANEKNTALMENDY